MGRSLWRWCGNIPVDCEPGARQDRNEGAEENVILGPALVDITASLRRSGGIHGVCQDRCRDVGGGKGSDGRIDGTSIDPIERAYEKIHCGGD